MDNVILVAGLACVIAAIVGGGLKAFGIEVPILASRTRQVILGLLGVILIVVGMSQRRTPTPDGGTHPPPQSASPTPPSAQNGGRPIKPPSAIGGSIAVNVNNNPRIVAPGGRTEISVLARTTDGAPIPFARVVLSVPGGVFEQAGTSEVTGETNEQGLYHAVWKTYEPAAYTGDMSYGIYATVTKEGFQEGRGESEVFVRK